MIKRILRALGIIKAERQEETKESVITKPVVTRAVDPLPKLKLAEQPGLDLLALQARYAKNSHNGKRRHHKAKVAPRPHHF